MQDVMSGQCWGGREGTLGVRGGGLKLQAGWLGKASVTWLELRLFKVTLEETLNGTSRVEI